MLYYSALLLYHSLARPGDAVRRALRRCVDHKTIFRIIVVLGLYIQYCDECSTTAHYNFTTLLLSSPARRRSMARTTPLPAARRVDNNTYIILTRNVSTSSRHPPILIHQLKPLNPNCPAPAPASRHAKRHGPTPLANVRRHGERHWGRNAGRVLGRHGGWLRGDHGGQLRCAHGGECGGRLGGRSCGGLGEGRRRLRRGATRADTLARTVRAVEDSTNSIAGTAAFIVYYSNIV